MPATPFHFGPGLLVKAAAPRQFSMAAYSLAQVVIDIESGYYLLQHASPVHRQAHTFALGGLIGFLCGLIVSQVGTWVARPRDVVPEALAAEYRLPIAVYSGIFGGIFHSVLDGIMHADIRPFRPFTDANPLYGIVSVRILYLFCIVTGLIGAVLLLARERSARRF
ncbi:MAG TPA: hypothetical protein VKB91_14140 [Gemmatimonadaceae bacterium]|nr:hypothetical protein [Gemmatimonadaceae bacterium]